jgi:uncharacterized membrane protein YczE
LNEEFNGAIEGLFLFNSKETGREFSSLAMVMETFATDAVLVAGVGAGTVLFVDFCPGALVFFLHYLTSRSPDFGKW